MKKIIITIIIKNETKTHHLSYAREKSGNNSRCESMKKLHSLERKFHISNSCTRPTWVRIQHSIGSPEHHQV